MSDSRLCTICGSLFDLDAPGVTVVQSRGGRGKRTTIFDASGRVHVLTTKRETEKKAAQPQEKGDERAILRN
jgi:hypothetical protein